MARRELTLESAISKLDRYDLLILDDIAYVTKDQAETSVLFELIAARYERRSLLITANQPFGEWGRIFPDQAMTLAAVDRLVHHATILEMNVESQESLVRVTKSTPPAPTRSGVFAGRASALELRSRDPLAAFSLQSIALQVVDLREEHLLPRGWLRLDHSNRVHEVSKLNELLRA